jgi:hypothetical protein
VAPIVLAHLAVDVIAVVLLAEVGLDKIGDAFGRPQRRSTALG